MLSARSDLSSETTGVKTQAQDTSHPGHLNSPEESAPLPARSGLRACFLFMFSTNKEQCVIYLPILHAIKEANHTASDAGAPDGLQGTMGS